MEGPFIGHSRAGHSNASSINSRLMSRYDMEGLQDDDEQNIDMIPPPTNEQHLSPTNTTMPTLLPKKTAGRPVAAAQLDPSNLPKYNQVLPTRTVLKPKRSRWVWEDEPLPFIEQIGRVRIMFLTWNMNGKVELSNRRAHRRTSRTSLTR
jgi:hypothetical protein